MNKQISIYKLFFLIIGVVTSRILFAADNSLIIVGEKQTLELVSPVLEGKNIFDDEKVEVQVSIKNSILNIQFLVFSKEINSPIKLKKGQYPFQFDVVEVFLSVSGKENGDLPYYELELGPYNASFSVKVNSLKKPFINGVKTGMIHQTQIRDGGWTANMALDLRNIGWDGDYQKLRGSLYAILGKGKFRKYYANNLLPMKKPNFHKPQFFKNLLFPESAQRH